MKRIVQILVLVVVVQTSFGQQQPYFSNFMLNDYFYNPAVAGSRDVHIANMSYRNQWTGFDEAPVTVNGNFYGSWKNQGKVGYGAGIVSDRTGLMSNNGLYLNYAQHFQLGDSLKLGIGVRPGYQQYRIRLYDARLADQGDEVLTGNVLSVNAIDLQSGFHLYHKSFFVMGSVQNILSKEIKFTTYNTSLAKHYNVIAGINLSPKKKNFVLQPAFMMQHVEHIPTQYTGMMKATFDNKYWVGANYRSDASAGLALGFTVKDRVTIGYGFDYALSGINKYQNGSHEIMLSFITTRNKPTIEEEDEELNKSILEEMQEKLKKKEEDDQ